MLEKIKGTARLNKRRVIQLMEADLNMMLHIIFGRKLIHRAQDKHLISPLQWGSRPNRSSQDVILMKHITCNCIRICKKIRIIFNNDGKAAFIHMVPSVGGIALRQLGARKNAVQTSLLTLEKNSYCIRKTMGISEESYSNHCKGLALSQLYG